MEQIEQVMVSELHIKAVELHQKILVNAQMAQASLFEMCNGLKEMRDSQLYKELGHETFESYCEVDVGLKQRQVYRYISIVENLGNDFLPLGTKIGVSKLYLLSTLPEEQRDQIMQEVDIEQVSKAEFEKVVSELKASTKEKKKIENELKQVSLELDEIKSKPIEVAVAEPDAETIRKAVQEKVDQIHIQKQKELNRIKSDYEEKIKALSSKPKPTYDDTKEVFKAYFTVAYDSFSRLIEFTGKVEDNSEYFSRIKSLLTTLSDTVSSMEE